MSLDDLLTAASPPTAPRSPELKRELHALVAEAEDVALGRRPRRRIALAVVYALSVVPVTAAASAAGLLPSWMPWTTEGGSSCVVAFRASPLGPDGEPLGELADADPATRRAVGEAARFLAAFDYDTLRDATAVESPSAAPAQDRDRAVEEDLAFTTLYEEVWAALEAHLRAQGMPSDRVGLGQAWKCE